MTTFIGRHGYVRYPVPGYLTTGPCEMPGCAEYTDALPAFMATLTGQPETPETPKLYVLDHCHEHGWIRGILCNSCNVVMVLADKDQTWNRKGWSDHLGIQMGYQDYRRNCPGCAIRLNIGVGIG